MQRAATSRSSSLISRVAIATGAAAALAAFVAAVISLVVANQFIMQAEDRRLRAAAEVALGEMPKSATGGGGSAGNDDDSNAAKLRSAMDEEQRELDPESIRIVLRDGTEVGLVLGGDDTVPAIPAGTCESRAALRVCAAQRNEQHLYLSAASPHAPPNFGLLVLSVSVAVVVAAAGAAFGARRTARWALEPLTRLRDSLDRAVADDPRKAVVAGDDTTSEVAALRAALESLINRLCESIDSARRFSADAAHELKTPLTVLRAEIDLLAESETIDDETRAVLEKLNVRLIALSTLVERLLTLANATADRSGLLKEAVALEDIAREVARRLGGGSTAARRIHVQADSPGMVRGDEVLLAALVENAVDNALKFSPDGAAVDIRVSEEKERVVFEVIDNGPGMRRADQARAFELFFRAPESRASRHGRETPPPGHGVGLALVAHIANAHNGTAAFVDAERGAHLRVTFPIWTSESEA